VTPSPSEIRRPEDGELCGYVTARDAAWVATTVFGTPLGTHATREDAERQVRTSGLAALAERWLLVDVESGHEEIVCIQHASPEEVTVALGYSSLPGVPTRTLTRAELDAGRWRLVRT
jgi:hypothetical protein